MALPDDLATLSPKRLALLALDLQARVDELESMLSEPIAIVGMACRFPMQADSPEAYWRALRAGRNGVGEIPADRFDSAAYYDADPATPGKMSTRAGAFLAQVDQFDPQFFGIAPREAQTMDPQQRLLLEVSWEALEDAAYTPRAMGGTRTGVFIGMCAVDYFQRVIAGDVNSVDGYWATGNSVSIAAGRLAYTYGLVGPALTIDTACSSSLVALHQACRSLRLRECDTALAGGSNVILSPVSYLTLSKGNMLAPDGQCKAFDARANGFVRGEGCGIVVLRRLRDAQQSGDRILAVIRGSAINQDGRSNGLTAPSGPAQQEVIRAALADARMPATAVSYVEAHGTGTALGDPIEAQALGAALGGARGTARRVLVGSVKTNIGHLEQVAGIAGLMKVVLALQHRELPPNLHFETPSPHIPWQDLPLEVVTKLTAWQPAAGHDKLVAGVSSFGFSGTNAHVIVEEAPAERERSAPERVAHVLTLSAASDTALAELARHYRAIDPAANLGDLTFTANVGREPLDRRAAVICSSRAELDAGLEALARSETRVDVLSPRKARAGGVRIAFLFTGQGVQQPGMGRELFDTQPVFRDALRRCHELLAKENGHDLLGTLYGEAGARLDETGSAQPALFAFEYALAELWKSFGIEPDWVLGHSVGEYAAACVAGCFTLEDGLRLIAERARLMQSLPQGGGMAAIFASEERVAEAVRVDPVLSIAALNGPENVVVSGPIERVDALVRRFAETGVQAQRLRVSHAFHSALVEPIVEEFVAFAKRIPMRDPGIELISNLTGRALGPGELDAAYWGRHLRQPVAFGRSIEQLLVGGVGSCIEIGPHPTLIGLALQNAEAVGRSWLPSLRRGRGDWRQLLATVAELHCQGVDIDWRAVHQGFDHRRIALPTYPFERRRYWIDETKASPPAVTERDAARRDHAAASSARELLYEVAWRKKPHRHDRGAASRAFRSPVACAHELEAQFRELKGRFHLDRFAAAIDSLDALARFHAKGALVAIESRGGLPASLDQRSTRLLEKLERLGRDANVTNREQLSFAIREAGATAELELLERAGDRIADVLFGDVDALEVLFPNGDASLVEAIYAATPAARAYNELVKNAIATLLRDVPEAATVRVVELGAGTGATTMSVLAGLGGRRVDYCFTDVSDVFLERARVRFASEAGMRFQRFDVERKGGQQGLEAGEFDLIVASNVIHATADIRKSLSHARELLAPGGILLLVESTGPLAWVDLTFGLTEGWWRFTDTDLRTSHPLLSRARWTEVFRECGFSEATAVPQQADERDTNLKQALIVGRADAGEAARHSRQEPVGSWLLLDTRDPLADAIAAHLERQGFDCIRSSAHSSGLVDETAVAAFVSQALASARTPVQGVVHILPSHHDADAQLLEGPARDACVVALGALQGIAARDSAAARLWIVTCGAQSIGEADELRAPVQSLLWGLGRVAAAEHPERWGGLIDAVGEPSVVAPAVVQELLGPDESQVALRSTGRHVARLTRRDGDSRNDDGPMRLRPQGTYLLTGGLGGIALKIAQRLVERGAKTLVLLGRSAPDSAAVLAIDRLRQLGAEVVVRSVDVANAAAVSELVAEIGRDLPPLRGIVHAAGVFDDRLLADQDWPRFAKVLAPKMLGAWNLHQAASGCELDFFGICSSAASLMPAAGLANYAAANAFLDAFAHFRRHRNLPAVTFDWGPWNGVGMAQAVGALSEERWADHGIETLDSAQALRAFEIGLRRSSPQIVVLDVDWRRFQQRLSDAAPFFAEVVVDQGSSRRAARAKTEAASRAPKAPSPSDRRRDIADVESAVHEEAARILRLPPGDLETDKPLVDSGLDSLMAVELRNRIQKLFEVSIPVGRILDGASVAWLVQHVRESTAARPSVTKPSNAAPEILAAVDAMTDDQVEAMLAKLLAEQNR